ncbi:MAG: hypothetical protein MUF31_10445 [Akkermansiaceae bacterium]|jgi:hypothetical protein|nr:hypothetical protein [Akkermansiaceae bacterium]
MKHPGRLGLVVLTVIGVIAAGNWFHREEALPDILPMPEAYHTDPYLFPPDYLAGLRLGNVKKLTRDEVRVRQLCELIVVVEQATLKKFGQDYHLNVDCDTCQCIIKLKPRTRVFDQSRVFVRDLANSAREILRDMNRNR